MMKIYRKISLFLMASFIFLAVFGQSAATVMAAEETYDEYEWLILDYEDLLSDEEEEEVYWYMEPILDYGNVIFQSVSLTEGTDYEKYSEDTYYDYFGNEPGVIFQIDMGHRKITLSSSTEVDDEIASERDSIVDNVYRYATDGDYARCATRCFDEVFTILNDGRIAHSMKYIDNAILAVLVSLILNFVIIFSGSKKKASVGEVIAATTASAVVGSIAVKKGILDKVYSPSSSDSGSGSSGGGGGGGGFSGGSSSHGF